jgi:hypothetical protein
VKVSESKDWRLSAWALLSSEGSTDSELRALSRISDGSTESMPVAEKIEPKVKIIEIAMTTAIESKTELCPRVAVVSFFIKIASNEYTEQQLHRCST